MKFLVDRKLAVPGAGGGAAADAAAGDAADAAADAAAGAAAGAATGAALAIITVNKVLRRLKSMTNESTSCSIRPRFLRPHDKVDGGLSHH